MRGVSKSVFRFLQHLKSPTTFNFFQDCSNTHILTTHTRPTTSAGIRHYTGQILIFPTLAAILNYILTCDWLLTNHLFTSLSVDFLHKGKRWAFPIFWQHGLFQGFRNWRLIFVVQWKLGHRGNNMVFVLTVQHQ